MPQREARQAELARTTAADHRHSVGTDHFHVDGGVRRDVYLDEPIGPRTGRRLTEAFYDVFASEPIARNVASEFSSRIQISINVSILVPMAWRGLGG